MTIGGSMINLPGQSIAAALRAEMHGYALTAEISEDGLMRKQVITVCVTL